MIYWFTGQPGAGKTTLAKLLSQNFESKSIIVDGDDIRAIYDNKDYSEVGRRKNIELAQNLAKFLHHKGYKVMVSLVSPYRDQREAFKEEMGNLLKEIYVHTTMERGREGYHVSNYEPPLTNFIDADTTNEDEHDTFEKIKKLL